jgi:hypothetical protein
MAENNQKWLKKTKKKTENFIYKPPQPAIFFRLCGRLPKR